MALSGRRLGAALAGQPDTRLVYEQYSPRGGTLEADVRVVQSADHGGTLAAVDVDMTDELYTRIATLTPTPPPATDRNEERSKHAYSALLTETKK